MLMTRTLKSRQKVRINHHLFSRLFARLCSEHRSLSFFSFRFHYMDFPDCLLLLLSISVFLLFSFSVFTLLVVGSMRQIKLTHVGFRAHVNIASRIVSYTVLVLTPTLQMTKVCSTSSLINKRLCTVYWAIHSYMLPSVRSNVDVLIEAGPQIEAGGLT